MKSYFVLFLMFYSFYITGCITTKKVVKKAPVLPPLPTLNALWTSNSPLIDGDLSDQAWKKAVTNNLQLVNGGMTKWPTSFQITWDDKNLYIAFKCTDPDVWATLKTDDDLWKEEVVEIFIDPDGDKKDYVEIEITSLNSTLDLLIPSRNVAIKGYSRWKLWTAKGLKTAVKVQGSINNQRDKDQGWIVEARIPWNCFKEYYSGALPPKNRDIWHMGIYRVEIPLPPEKEEDSSWSVLKGTFFHEPDRFGSVIFKR